MQITELQPQGASKTLSIEVQYYMLLQVPSGRLARDKDIRAYLAKKFGVNFVEYETPYHRYVQPGYMYRILDHIPLHRLVSTNGYISDPNRQAEHLQKEDFEILPTKGNYSPRVKDYKDFLFNFDKETDIDVAVLQKVNEEGLFDFLPKE